jgi:class 3 adenylate cyclase
MLRADDYPLGAPQAAVDALCDAVEATWGEDAALDVYRLWEPDVEASPETMDNLLRFHRRSASPAEAGDALRRTMDIDVRSVLPSIHVPALVVHRTDDLLVRVDVGRYLAERIPGAKFVELPGHDHTIWAGDVGRLIDVVREWVTGAPAPLDDDIDRVLATVLFTDIVGSTQRAAALGDRQWTELLDAHDRAVDGELERHRGRRVKSTGDGVLATFDGPARAVRCAHAIADAMRPLGIEVRAGVHAGEVEMRGDDIGGIAVHIGARVAALAGPGEVLVSSTVRDLVAGSGLAFADAGQHTLTGIDDDWRLYRSQ